MSTSVSVSVSVSISVFVPMNHRFRALPAVAFRYFLLCYALLTGMSAVALIAWATQYCLSARRLRLGGLHHVVTLVLGRDHPLCAACVCVLTVIYLSVSAASVCLVHVAVCLRLSVFCRYLIYSTRHSKHSTVPLAPSPSTRLHRAGSKTLETTASLVYFSIYSSSGVISGPALGARKAVWLVLSFVELRCFHCRKRTRASLC